MSATPKKKSPKVPPVKEDPVEVAAQNLAKAQHALREWRELYEDVIEEYDERCAAERTAVEELKDAAKTAVRKDFELGDDYDQRDFKRVLDTPWYSVEITDITKREVDVGKLLKALPKAADWPGLLTVSVAQFDALVSTKTLPEARVKSLLKPPDKDRTFKATVKPKDSLEE